MKRCPWFVSMHGGHSRDYCDHATDSLPDMIQTAIDKGMVLYGITEHAPRYEPDYLYPEEVAMGWTIDKIQQDFARYSADSQQLIERFGKSIGLLRAFEIEVAPRACYIERMQRLRDQHGFDYIVGSVHYVNDLLFDHRDMFADVVRNLGGLERLVLAYFEQMTEMVLALKPEVVGHLDVYRKYAGNASELESSAVKRAAQTALEAIRESGSILDVNTGAYRKGLTCPYPSPWLVREARERGIPFCFGDDSHSCADVGSGIEPARAYLLENGVESIRILRHDGDKVIPQDVPLR